MIQKIISGGQYGADQAGLRVGMDLNLKTGGMAPKGFKTKFGDRPLLAKVGLKEDSNSSYRPRTEWNVKNSDATMRFAKRFSSPGEILTLNYIKKYNKPYFDIDLKEPYNILIFDIMDFFYNNNVHVLNIAGNCGGTIEESKIIYKLTRELLTKYITIYHKNYWKCEWTLGDIKS